MLPLGVKVMATQEPYSCSEGPYSLSAVNPAGSLRLATLGSVAITGCSSVVKAKMISAQTVAKSKELAAR